MHKVLAKNIKYLRKERNLSQDALASEIGLKRSNITAYESKNVEPRLKIILELARFFDVDIKALISEDLEAIKNYKPFEGNKNMVSNSSRTISASDDLSDFIDNSTQIRKILDGFKAFYFFKKKQVTNPINQSSQKLNYEIENFLQISEHLLANNEQLIRSLTKEN